MYQLKTSAKGSDDLSLAFDRDRCMRQRELTNNKNLNVKYHVGIMLKDIFGFSEHKEKATYGLGYQLTPTGKKDDVEKS